MQRPGDQQADQTTFPVPRSMKLKLMTLGGLLSCALCTGASAGETPYRRAELVDFVNPTLPRSDIPRSSRVVRLDFGEKIGVSERRSDLELPPRIRIASTSLPTDRIRIPRWMRRSSPAEFRGAGSGHIALIDGCMPRPYRPSTILGRGAERRRKAFYPLVHHAACEAGIPVALMDALLMQESRYNPIAISPKGAFGLGQLMPATAKQLGVDRYSLLGNLRGAARYLSWQLREFGRVDLALAAYNAGPGRVRAAKGLPRIAETRNYVRIVLTNWNTIESNHALSQSGPALHPSGWPIWRGDRRTGSSWMGTNE